MRIRFDVSEMKTFKDCGRKWELSSRNAYHMRPKVTSPNLVFGTLFHEALHALYAAAEPNVDSITETITKELAGDTVAQKVMTKMIHGYYAEVLPDDKARYKVLDIERGFNFPIPELAQAGVSAGQQPAVDPETGEIIIDPEQGEVVACGSIDMIALERETNKVWGFEHKSCKNFRTNVYHAMDEQPRMYFLALSSIVADLNKHLPEGHEPYTVGGIYITEVRKLSTKFEYQRRTCVYSPQQMKRFYEGVLHFGGQIVANARAIETGNLNLAPSPSFLKCAMCDYAPICEQYSDHDLDLDLVLDEFTEEFEIRNVDHLDEKMERLVSDDE